MDYIEVSCSNCQQLKDNACNKYYLQEAITCNDFISIDMQDEE